MPSTDAAGKVYKIMVLGEKMKKKKNTEQNRSPLQSKCYPKDWEFTQPHFPLWCFWGLATTIPPGGDF